MERSSFIFLSLGHLHDCQCPFRRLLWILWRTYFGLDVFDLYDHTLAQEQHICIRNEVTYFIRRGRHIWRFLARRIEGKRLTTMEGSKLMPGFSSNCLEERS